MADHLRRSLAWLNRILDEAGSVALSALALVIAYSMGRVEIDGWWLLIPALMVGCARYMAEQSGRVGGMTTALNALLGHAEPGKSRTIVVTVEPKVRQDG